MKVSKTLVISATSLLFLGMLVTSSIPAMAGAGEVRLSASMVSGAASGKADYRERGNRKRLNVEAEDLPGTTPAALGVFVNGTSQIGTIALAACPVPAQALLCGEMELNAQDGQAVPTLKAGDVISIGVTANNSVLSGALH